MLQLGSPAWLAAAGRAVDASEEYRRAANGWRWPLGLAFLDTTDARFGVLDLHEGRCRGARAVDRREFERAPFRLSADVAVWHRVLAGAADPMRCILLRDLHFEGDRLTALRYLPAAKALLEAMGTIDTEVPVG